MTGRAAGRDLGRTVAESYDLAASGRGGPGVGIGAGAGALVGAGTDAARAMGFSQGYNIRSLGSSASGARGGTSTSTTSGAGAGAGAGTGAMPSAGVSEAARRLLARVDSSTARLRMKQTADAARRKGQASWAAESLRVSGMRADVGVQSPDPSARGSGTGASAVDRGLVALARTRGDGGDEASGDVDGSALQRGEPDGPGSSGAGDKAKEGESAAAGATHSASTPREGSQHGPIPAGETRQ